MKYLVDVWGIAEQVRPAVEAALRPTTSPVIIDEILDFISPKKKDYPNPGTNEFITLGAQLIAKNFTFEESQAIMLAVWPDSRAEITRCPDEGEQARCTAEVTGREDAKGDSDPYEMETW